MSYHLTHAVRCEKCDQTFFLPLPILPSTEEYPTDTPKDIWITNFLCPVHRDVLPDAKSTVVWASKEQLRPKETAFYVRAQCGEAGCGLPVTIHSVALDNIEPKTFVETYFPQSFTSKCQSGHTASIDRLTLSYAANLSFSPSFPSLDADLHVLLQFWKCHNCNKPYLMRPSMRPLLRHILPSQSKGSETVVIACEACNDLRHYSKLPPFDMVDSSGRVYGVVVGKFFHARISCGDNKCESRIEVIAPTTDAYYLGAMKKYSLGWNPHDVVCAAGHPIRKPVSLISIEELSL
jgi:hypothetical protein